MSKDSKKSPVQQVRAIRWLYTSAGVYPGENISSPGTPLVFTEGSVVGIGTPLGPEGAAVSPEFAKDLIKAGHAEGLNEDQLAPTVPPPTPPTPTEPPKE